MDTSLQNVLNAGTAALEVLGLKYAVVGGLAVSAWALPRTTRDVDLYAEIPDRMRSRLQAELEARSFHVPAMAEELQQYGMFRSKHFASGVFLDIFDAIGPLGASILDRRKRITVESHELWLISPEDLALLKAFSDRARDFDDLVTLCTHMGARLDYAYITQWAQTLDESLGTNEVSERLEQARQKANAPSK